MSAGPPKMAYPEKVFLKRRHLTRAWTKEAAFNQSMDKKAAATPRSRRRVI